MLWQNTQIQCALRAFKWANNQFLSDRSHIVALTICHPNSIIEKNQSFHIFLSSTLFTWKNHQISQILSGKFCLRNGWEPIRQLRPSFWFMVFSFALQNWQLFGPYWVVWLLIKLRWRRKWPNRYQYGSKYKRRTGPTHKKLPTFLLSPTIFHAKARNYSPNPSGES